MPDRCQVLPLPDHQIQFLINGHEKTRWHFGPSYPRPFFYPLMSASGESLTRMGHPGAPNHDHHRSVWFAHHKVFGQNFWGDGTGTLVKQKEWIAMEDGEKSARLAMLLEWLDGHDPTPLMQQTVIVEMRPVSADDWVLEIQSEFVPTAAELELQQTNFGFLAVRVSKQIAEFFGGGKLTNSDLKTSEKNLFGNPSKWMDYSGSQYSHSQQAEIAEGVTYIDHPTNIGQPTRWHVRKDGWMGASPFMKAAHNLKKDSPLVLRYLLYVHAGECSPEKIDQQLTEFAQSKPLAVATATKPHTHRQVNRMP